MFGKFPVDGHPNVPPLEVAVSGGFSRFNIQALERLEFKWMGF